MIQKQRTKGQHYIPNKSYLGYFTDYSTFKKPLLWVYEDRNKIYKDFQSIIPQHIAPDKFCKENYLYESRIFEVNSIENALSQLEADYKEVIDAKVFKMKQLSSYDKGILARYISALEMRTPLNKANSDKFLKDTLEKVIKIEEGHKLTKPSPIRLELEEALSDNSAFTTALATSVDFNRYIVCDFHILLINNKITDSFFITSDFPVTMVNFSNANTIYGITPMDITSETVIPISPRMAILVNNINLNGYQEIDYNYIDEINSRVVRRTNKYIITDRKLEPNFIQRLKEHFPQSLLLLNLEKALNNKRKKRFKIN